MKTFRTIKALDQNGPCDGCIFLTNFIECDDLIATMNLLDLPACQEGYIYIIEEVEND